MRRVEKTRGHVTGDLFILSHAVREGRRDAFTRIHRAHRILARIIPRRQSLHGLIFAWSPTRADHRQIEMEPTIMI